MHRLFKKAKALKCGAQAVEQIDNEEVIRMCQLAYTDIINP